MKTIDAIYNKYAADVYRYALGLCGNPLWADDLTSETFLRALVSTKPIRLETVKAYLFTITRNLYLKDLQKHNRFTILHDDLQDQKADTENSVEQNEQFNTMLIGLQQLPESDRTILLMRAQEKIPYSDIAAALGLTLSAVKVRAFRARQKLNMFMKEYEDGDY